MSAIINMINTINKNNMIDMSGSPSGLLLLFWKMYISQIQNFFKKNKTAWYIKEKQAGFGRKGRISADGKIYENYSK